MPTEIFDAFSNLTYETAECTWPGLTERIFKAAKEVSPRQFRFELDQLDLRFNMENVVDRPTRTVIRTVLSRILDEPHLLMTHGDIQYAYARFAHLIWLFEIVRQGIYTDRIDQQSGRLVYWRPTISKKEYTPRTQFVTPPFVSVFWK